MDTDLRKDSSYSEKTLLLAEQGRREKLLQWGKCGYLLRFTLVLLALLLAALLIASGVLLGLLLKPPDKYSGTYQHAAVATDAAECSRIGVEMLKKGGTAVDAAVASVFCVGVMNPQSTGIGGGGFMVYYNAASQESTVIDFREKAPWNITEETMDKYKNDPSSTTNGMWSSL